MVVLREMFYNESSTSPWFQAKVIYAVNSSKSCIHQVVLVSAFDRKYLFEVFETMSVLICGRKAGFAMLRLPGFVGRSLVGGGWNLNC